VPTGLVVLTQRPLEGLRERHVALGGQLQRLAVGGDERLGPRRFAGEPLELGDEHARLIGIHRGEGPRAVVLAGTEHLEEVELDVAQVGPVVAHRRLPGSVLSNFERPLKVERTLSQVPG
jgi:hypothetical protein